MIKNVSEYPHHSQMKRNRLEKLKEANGKCEVCGKEAGYIHHLDESKDNHKMENLAVLCMKCHSILHADRTNAPEKSTKYSREYGMTLIEMINTYGGVYSTYMKLHKKGLLHQELDKLDKRKK